MPARTNAPPPTASPRVQLSDLPIEVKTRIVELCAEQDERFREWTAAVDTIATDYSLQDGAEDARARVAAMHGRSLGSLFRASKEWSSIAAPYIFKTIVASKTTSNTFRCLVAFRRHHHFTKVVLDPADSIVYDYLIPLLHNLTGVRELAIHHAFLSHIFTDAATRQHFLFYVDDAQMVDVGLSALLKLLRQASSLTLTLATTWQFKAIIRQTSALKSLALALDCLADGATELVKLLQLVPSLQDLHLTGTIETTVDVPTPLPAKLPKLVSLRLEASAIQPDFLRVAHLFAHHLASLRIAAPYVEGDLADGDVGGDLGDAVFPRLERLELDGHDISILPILSAMTPSAFPSLTYIRFASMEIDDISDIDEAPTSVIHTFDAHEDHPLRLVEMYDPSRFPYIAESDFVKEWNATHRVRLSMQPCRLPDSTYFKRFGVIEPQRTLVARREAVERTVDYLVNETRRARAVQGEEAAAGEYRRLARVLQAAELERVAMAD